MRVIAKSLAGLSLALVLGSAAATPVTYTFTFTDFDTPNQVDGTGNFVTGDGSATDPGYFLLTSLTYTSIRIDGALLTGSAIQTQFASGSAYDPTTGAFISHFFSATGTGLTANDYGGGLAKGSIGSFSTIDSNPFNFQQSDSGLRGEARLAGGGFTSFDDVAAHSIIGPPLADPGTVPEPGSIALIGLGLVGLALSRRTSKR